MDKCLIFAVAGSGKTQYLIDQLDLEKRVLLVTYTINNYRNIRVRIIQKFGYMPPNINIFSYFSFLYSFCFKPFLLMRLDVKGILFEECQNRYARGDDRLISPSRWVYYNRLAKLVADKNIMDNVRARLEKYFDVLMIDEVQDFAGNDFNFLVDIAPSNMDMIFVGDFFQHTFDTSRDGNVNRNLHQNYEAYKQKFEDMEFEPDEDTLSYSYRCSPSICRFITENLQIEMQSHRDDETEIIQLSEMADVEPILSDRDIIKLFFRDRRKYPLQCKNWGESKGEDHYNDVCIALNDTTLKAFEKNQLHELAPQTKNKLYVALTRTRNKLIFIPENKIKHLRS